MLDRWVRKASKNAYDPQIGAAATAQANLAQSSDAWNRDYYEKYVEPSMVELTNESKVNSDQQQKLFNLDYSQAQLQDQRYRTLGIPAEDKYYQMVNDYSAPEEQERQANAAIGDVRTAAAGQAAQQQRQMGALGIDPTSPAALAARSDASVMNAATEAGAATRARDAAKTLGMSLTSDAANFGRGGQSGILQFGQGAGGASSAGAAGAAAAGQVVPGGAANMNTSFGLGQKAYGANLDAYTSLGKTSLEQPSALTGIGMLAGQLGSAAIKTYGSDRRLKKHAEKLATLAHDIGLWVFRYIWEPDDTPLHVGYMADEVEPVFPDAVLTGPGGYKRVDYSKVLI